jgi:hypothetical protein
MYRRGFKSWCENVALQHRRDLGLAPTDPLDPRRLAETMDVIVWAASEVPGIDPDALHVLVEEDPNSWSAATVTVGTRRAIVLNPRHSGARPASDLMHELAHLLLAHTPARMDVTEDGLMILTGYDRRQEDEAAWLAGCLLLPRDAIMLIRRLRLDDRAAAKRYGVSTAMLQYRIRMTGVDRQLGRYAASSRRVARG